MCGIYLTNLDYSDKQVDRKLFSIKHRGPDYQAFIRKNNVILGHTRLSIIDLNSRANQPMEFGDYIIVYNGEIYNFKELRRHLINEGFQFRTNSDTEVILNSYDFWGDKLVDHLNGMYAFSIYDKKKRIIFSARDRLGQKPFYYYWDNGKFEICSQLKPLSHNKTLNQEALTIYLQTGYIPSPWTVFNETKKLKPGHTLTIDLNNNTIKEIKYWDITKTKINRQISYEEAKDKLHELIKDAVKIRLNSDVPYGSYLSGGVDSALITSIASKFNEENLNTFTIGFENPNFDESKISKKFSKIIGTFHNEKTCKPEDLKNILPKFFEIFDEPFADSSAIPSLLLNKFAKRKATVVLSGDGGDESFLGYNHFRFAKKLSFIFYFPYSLRSLVSNVIPKKLVNKKIEAIKLLLKNKDRYALVQGVFIGYSSNLLIKRKTSWLKQFNYLKNISENLIQNIADLNIKMWLEGDSNVKVDRASMAYGVEVRSPFLDYRIIEFARNLPISFRSHSGVSKKILKDILSEYIPRKIFDVPKKGFSLPIKHWIKTDLFDDFNESLRHPCLEKVNDLDLKKVDYFFKSHLENKGDYSNYLWRVFILSKWLQNNE